MIHASGCHEKGHKQEYIDEMLRKSIDGGAAGSLDYLCPSLAARHITRPVWLVSKGRGACALAGMDPGTG